MWARSWLSYLERRFRACVVLHVPGSNPVPTLHFYRYISPLTVSFRSLMLSSSSLHRSGPLQTAKLRQKRLANFFPNAPTYINYLLSCYKCLLMINSYWNTNMGITISRQYWEVLNFLCFIMKKLIGKSITHWERV